jgi:hypothetical protein
MISSVTLASSESFRFPKRVRIQLVTKPAGASLSITSREEFEIYYGDG